MAYRWLSEQRCYVKDREQRESIHDRLERTQTAHQRGSDTCMLKDKPRPFESDEPEKPIEIDYCLYCNARYIEPKNLAQSYWPYCSNTCAIRAEQDSL